MTDTKRHATNAAAIMLLQERWPKCFAIYEQRRRPLKIGIHNDLLIALNGTLPPLELSHALRAYTGNAYYLTMLRKGAWRLDLDGKPAGTVTAKDEASARQTLAKRKARHTPKPQPQPPQPKRLSL